MAEYFVVGNTCLKTKVIEFPKKKKTNNYKVNEKQEVYPFRTQEDLKKMHEYFVSHEMYRDDLMFVLGINVGLRASDLLNLKWGEVIDANTNEIANGVTVKEKKTKKFRTFYLNSSCEKAITEYRKYYWGDGEEDKEEYIFKSKKDGTIPIGVRPAGLILKKAAMAVGIQYNVGTHSLRKTFGYHQLKAHNGDALFLCELQEMFNHSSPKITLRYCGLEQEKMEQYYNDVNLLQFNRQYRGVQQ